MTCIGKEKAPERGGVRGRSAKFLICFRGRLFDFRSNRVPDPLAFEIALLRQRARLFFDSATGACAVPGTARPGVHLDRVIQCDLHMTPYLEQIWIVTAFNPGS